MSKTIRVLLIDDEPKLRASWQKLLTSAPDLECVGALANTTRVVEEVRERAPHVLLLDLIIPGHDSVEAIRQVTNACPDCRVVVYSAYTDGETTRQTIDAGAWGFVDKMTPIEQIMGAIRQVAGGQVVLPESPLIESRPGSQVPREA